MANSRFIAAIDSGRAGIRKVGSSQGLAGRSGIDLRRSATEPKSIGLAAHSGSGLGQ